MKIKSKIFKAIDKNGILHSASVQANRNAMDIEIQDQLENQLGFIPVDFWES